MAKRGGYAQDFKNRFGIYARQNTDANGKRRIWIQAVSVGELRAIEPLVKRLHDSGNYWIALTTTTSTAYAILQNEFPETTDFRGYFPLDFLPCSHRAWNLIQPDVAVLTESELWPEHMHQAHRRGIPLLLINARLSNRSYRRYQKFRPLTAFFRRYLSKVSAATATDAERFRALGLSPERVVTSGNLKLDKDVQPRLTAPELHTLKREMGFTEDSRIILGSSTWPGEEAMLCRIFKRLKDEFPQLKLLIVPRHAERKRALADALKAFGMTHHFRSDGRQASTNNEIYVADTTGELPMLTQPADAAFIGKSMPPHTEAQSMIEPAILGIPAWIGPGYANFQTIVEGLIEQGLITEVADEEALEAALRQFFGSGLNGDPFQRKAETWYQANRGALEKTLQLIESA
ncbi:MAG: glycosyltransferase N-terminal domain-containing protein [Verrucomicrobiota bacterium]